LTLDIFSVQIEEVKITSWVMEILNFPDYSSELLNKSITGHETPETDPGSCLFHLLLLHG
jgi:hypothetical protein